MELEALPHALSICKLASLRDFDPDAGFYFIGKTDEELSLVCRTEDAPAGALNRDDGWRGFRIRGVLDFSLVGVLSKLSAVLAANGIGIFAVSTYNTDYILVKARDLDRALAALASSGYAVTGAGEGSG